MGKGWDKLDGDPDWEESGGFSKPGIGERKTDNAMERWHQGWLREAYRILKPGGIIKAFSGTRTKHRLERAMVNAGFEILPSNAWCFGSGFPKSLNIGKALDKMAGQIEAGTSVSALKQRLRELFDASGKTRKQIDEECGFRACNYLSSQSDEKQPDPWFNVLPPQQKWLTLKEVLGVAEELDQLFAEAEREVVGQQTKARKTDSGVPLPTEGETEYKTWDVTMAATDEAKRWEGWGTALKPAHEPVVVGRKPVE